MTGVWAATGVILAALGVPSGPPGGEPHAPAAGMADKRKPQAEAAPAYRYGFDRGWREGSENGHRDGRSGRDSKDVPKEVRDTDRGYDSWMGARGHYVAGYREGYAAGYRRAYTAARPDRKERRTP